jgi:hypothetical protein
MGLLGTNYLTGCIVHTYMSGYNVGATKGFVPIFTVLVLYQQGAHCIESQCWCISQLSRIKMHEYRLVD